jgi:hypothetical protein
MCPNESGRLESRPLVVSTMVAPSARLERASEGFETARSVLLSYEGVTNLPFTNGFPQRIFKSSA